ncbi:MAG: hypothetical protein K8S54_15620 [Spirochaetia bacterium]|nr:hypothetical protein [Spirochaetia bacterium]
MRFLPIILAIALLSQCKDASKEFSVKFKDFRISEQPEGLPGGLAANFRYQPSRSLLSATYEPDTFASSPEGAVELETADSAEKIEAYYFATLRDNGWKIIQSKNTPEEILIMAESAYSEVVTIIVRGKSPTHIKLYIRRLGRDA